MDYETIKRSIGYRFCNEKLLQQALTHRSHGVPHNERLEFLGDSVLNCVVAAELFAKFADLAEGELSRVRAGLVNQQSLHAVALTLDLGSALLLGEGELKSGGARRPSILADTLEALVGAVFLDGGFDAARALVLRVFDDALKNASPATLGKDAKTLLQEFLQARHIALPQYRVVGTTGVAHEQTFCIECSIPELDIITQGTGPSRRSAEQAAAVSAFELVNRS